MLNRPMIAATVLAILIGGSAVTPPAPTAVAIVPDEPDALMLPEAPTYQAVVADVDGDGARDVVRMVGTEDEAIEIEAWGFVDGAGWRELAVPVLAIPSRSTSEPDQLVYADAPARLIVRRVDGAERATLVRQPRFEEPGLEIDCCLVLHDIVARDRILQLTEVAEQLPNAGAILALDMDGDSTDEVLVTLGRPPLGDTTFPTDARVLRWAGDRFAPPVLTELQVGSGFSPFILGDTDGIPGDEAAFIGAQSRLHRLSLADGDLLVAESAESAILDAVAVPIDERRGIATLSGLSGLEIRSWPRGAPPGENLGTRSMRTGDLLGVAGDLAGRPVLAIQREDGSVLILGLPTLESLSPLAESSAASNATSGPLRPFVGWLPGGDRERTPTLFVGGGALTADGLFGATATLAGAMPIGLVGPDREWIALLHGAVASPAHDPAGGRLEVPVFRPGSGVSLVPWLGVFDEELESGRLEPALDGATLDGDDLLVGAEGFSAGLSAPPGSRVYVQAGPREPLDVEIVPESGTVRVAVRPEPNDEEPTVEAAVAVVTPGGRSYLATWELTILDQAPILDAAADTAFGSASVLVAGEASPFARVRIDGQEVDVDAEGRFALSIELPPWPTALEVVATDRVGNETRVTVVGVGWFDYRALPWTAIVIAGVAVVGGVLALRAPRIREEVRPVEEDGELEELDPED